MRLPPQVCAPYYQQLAIVASMATVLCRFLDAEGRTLVGQPTATDDDGIPTAAQLLASQDILGGDLTLTSETVAVSKLLAPISPVAIVCIGLNYAQHAAESGMAAPERPVVFMKTVSTLNHPGDPIDLPKIETKPDYEVELAIVIGKQGCKDVSKEEALDYVLGYTVANDVSGRLWQIEQGGGQWCFGKSFDTFTPLGPVIATTAAIPDPQTLDCKTTIDGEILQNSNTSDMIFSCADIVAFRGHHRPSVSLSCRTKQLHFAACQLAIYRGSTHIALIVLLHCSLARNHASPRNSDLHGYPSGCRHGAISAALVKAWRNGDSGD